MLKHPNFLKSLEFVVFLVFLALLFFFPEVFFCFFGFLEFFLVFSISPGLSILLPGLFSHWFCVCDGARVYQKSNTSAYQNLSPIHLLYFHYLLLHDFFSFCFVACIWFGRSTFLCKRMDIDCIALRDCCVVLLGQEQHDEVMAVWFHLIDAGGIVFEPAECPFTN